MITCPQFPGMAQGEARHALVDWGDNTAGALTGALGAGDTLASCTIALDSSPSGSSAPTLGSVTVNGSPIFVNGRSCAIGEATSVLITMGASQTCGQYRFKLVGTTTLGETLPRFIRIQVVPGGN